MTDQPPGLCEDKRMQALLARAEADSEDGVRQIDEALRDFPGDPRLHFLKGSLLVELKRFIDAHQAMSQAVQIAPGFELARFQLGFFELTSGEVEAALATWKPLKSLPEDHWMLCFVEGLEHLVADRFADCIVSLKQGMAKNTENLPLNNDMQLIVEQCGRILSDRAGAKADDETEADVSATSFLLDSRRR